MHFLYSGCWVCLLEGRSLFPLLCLLSIPLLRPPQGRKSADCDWPALAHTLKIVTSQGCRVEPVHRTLPDPCTMAAHCLPSGKPAPSMDSLHGVKKEERPALTTLHPVVSLFCLSSDEPESSNILSVYLIRKRTWNLLTLAIR